MTAFTQTLAASQTFSGGLLLIRWYYGSFKEISIGITRAVSRAIANYITQKQD